MKIALFCEAYALQLTGTAAHVSALALGLQKLGHSVLIVTSDLMVQECAVKNGILSCPAKEEECQCGQTMRGNAISSLSDLLSAFAPELIHLHDFGALGMAGLKYAASRGLPVYLTIHSLYDAVHGCGSGFSRASGRASMRRNLIKILEGSHGAAATSARTKELLRRLGLLVPLMRMPLCVDTALFSPSLPEPDMGLLRERWSVVPGCEVFLFAGALQRDNNVAALLELWRTAVSPQDRLHLLIAGTGTLAAELKEKAQLIGITERVTFCGALSRKELAGCYVAARGFLSASRSPCMKYAPIEAAACGTPSLLAAGGANSAVLVSGVNGFTYKTPQEFKDYIHKLAALDAEGRVLLKKLVSKTTSGLTSTALAKAALELYEV